VKILVKREAYSRCELTLLIKTTTDEPESKMHTKLATKFKIFVKKGEIIL